VATRQSILVLEDSQTQGNLISKMFVECGADVQLVSTAREFSMSPDLFDQKFSAAIIDVHFGEVSGLKLIEPVSRRWPAIVNVMMTANSTDDYAVLAEARNLGAHLVLKKPFDKVRVSDLLKDIESIQITGRPRQHVVVIDDSKTSCRIATEVLRSYGYRVSGFQTGEDAIRQLNFDHVDAVLTDLNMPGMPGEELICLVRDVWENIGIIAMSADASNKTRFKEADAFLPKPFGAEELIHTVGGVLAKDVEVLDC